MVCLRTLVVFGLVRRNRCLARSHLQANCLRFSLRDLSACSRVMVFFDEYSYEAPRVPVRDVRMLSFMHCLTDNSTLTCLWEDLKVNEFWGFLGTRIRYMRFVLRVYDCGVFDLIWIRENSGTKPLNSEAFRNAMFCNLIPRVRLLVVVGDMVTLSMRS